jgi:hypothetical protein
MHAPYVCTQPHAAVCLLHPSAEKCTAVYAPASASHADEYRDAKQEAKSGNGGSKTGSTTSSIGTWFLNTPADADAGFTPAVRGRSRPKKSGERGGMAEMQALRLLGVMLKQRASDRSPWMRPRRKLRN